MKYIIINSTIRQESTGQITRDLYKFLVDRNNEVIFCYGRDKQENKDPNIIKIDWNIEVLIHVMLARITGLQGYFSNHATNKLIKIIRRFKPDAVIIGSMHGYYINFTRLLNELKKKHILTYCYLFDEYPFLGKCPFSGNCTKYEVECNRCPQNRDFPKSVFFDTSKKIFNDKLKTYEGFSELNFIGIPYTISKAKESAIIKKTSPDLIDFGWGIDTKGEYKPRDVTQLKKNLHIPDNHIVVLAVASYKEVRKGIKKFYYRAAQSLMNEPITFIHIGFDGNKEEKPDWENLIVLPFISNQKELSFYFSLADLFVIPSLSEGQPTVSLISLCCGTPVLGFDISGVPYAAPAPYGKYIEAENVHLLIEAIRNTTKKTEKTIMECRNYAEENIEKDSINKKLLDTIEKDIRWQKGH